MLRYVLAVTFAEGVSSRQKLFIRKAIGKLASEDKYQIYTEARRLSKLAGVQRVTATCVSTHNVGVWRNGRKS